jgi:hypothetical protein
MGSVTEARRAVEVLSGQDFMGRPLQLSGAKPNSRSDSHRLGAFLWGRQQGLRPSLTSSRSASPPQWP